MSPYGMRNSSRTSRWTAIEMALSLENQVMSSQKIQHQDENKPIRANIKFSSCTSPLLSRTWFYVQKSLGVSVCMELQDTTHGLSIGWLLSWQKLEFLESLLFELPISFFFSPPHIVLPSYSPWGFLKRSQTCYLSTWFPGFHMKFGYRSSITYNTCHSMCIQNKHHILPSSSCNTRHSQAPLDHSCSRPWVSRQISVGKHFPRWFCAIVP